MSGTVALLAIPLVLAALCFWAGERMRGYRWRQFPCRVLFRHRWAVSAIGKRCDRCGKRCP